MRLPGWVNTDIVLGAEYYLDASQPWPLAPGSVSHVYGDNFIEHLRLPAVRMFLQEARRVMPAGGRIRLVTPDVGNTARIYLEDGAEAQALMERHRRHGYSIAHRVDVLRVLFGESGHWLGYCFDEQSLTEELEAAGFVNVQRCHVGESADPVMRGLEIRVEPIDGASQLILEASVPT